jgi:signal peptidase I
MSDPVQPTGGAEPPSDSTGAHAPTATSLNASTAADPTSSPSEQTPSAPGPTPVAKPRKEESHGGLAFLRELPVLLLVAFLLALLIKTFLVQAFYIPSESMTPTLMIGDRVLVNKVVYHLHDPRRGDIIVFSDPHPAQQPHRNAAQAVWHWLTEGFGVSTSPDKDFIKRVIGLPGESVEVHNGVVFVDGKALTEPYITAAAREIPDYGPFKVPADSLFVMGDNRGNSNDSRFQLGPIPFDKVIGRAFVVIWPPSRVGLLHGL